MTRKVVVNGLDEDPLFTYLKDQSRKGQIKWDFTKFLIDRDGHLVKQFAPITNSEKIEILIVEVLKVNQDKN